MIAAERIQLKYPLDGTNFDISVPCSSANIPAMKPGRVVVQGADGNAVLCNPAADATHRALPVLFVNLDVETRGDASRGGHISRNGTRRGSVPCIHGAGLIIDLKVSECFITGSAPALGDYVLKSTGGGADAGKLQALTATEVQALVTATTIAAQDVPGMIVGTVMNAPDANGFVRIRTR